MKDQDYDFRPYSKLTSIDKMQIYLDSTYQQWEINLYPGRHLPVVYCCLTSYSRIYYLKITDVYYYVSVSVGQACGSASLVVLAEGLGQDCSHLGLEDPFWLRQMPVHLGYFLGTSVPHQMGLFIGYLSVFMTW
jgi:hypothetical protein